jgi:hypothetical protein
LIPILIFPEHQQKEKKKSDLKVIVEKGSKFKKKQRWNGRNTGSLTHDSREAETR